MAIEIVDFPIKNGGSFHSFLLVHQRVSPVKNQRLNDENRTLGPCPWPKEMDSKRFSIPSLAMSPPPPREVVHQYSIKI